MTLLAPVPVFQVPVLHSIDAVCPGAAHAPVLGGWPAPAPATEDREARRKAGGRVGTAPCGSKRAYSVRSLLEDAFTKAPQHISAVPRLGLNQLKWVAQRRKIISFSDSVHRTVLYHAKNLIWCVRRLGEFSCPYSYRCSAEETGRLCPIL